jgi:hypothetical protein
MVKIKVADDKDHDNYNTSIFCKIKIIYWPSSNATSPRLTSILIFT